MRKIIQGGMGVGVSNWKLARAVSCTGQLGVVSGTGINSVLIRRLQDGDEGGHARRALLAFPDSEISGRILQSYFLPGGRSEKKTYKRGALPSINPSQSFQQLMAVAAFAEVFLAKEGHSGVVGINFLEKLQLSNLAGIYGAMLAGVDCVLMGAGIPREIPGVLDAFSRQEKASLKVALCGASADVEIRTSFDPGEIFPALHSSSLSRPFFLAVVSSATLATHLARKSTGKVDGFVIEGFTAGGHNAPPRGPMRLNEVGEPIYAEKDHADLSAFRELGIPFWLAGSFGAPGKLQEALGLGASGIQVGTAFAFCEESGLTNELRQGVLQNPDLSAIFTDPLASPTGFPFKVVQQYGTLSETKLYQNRPRKCDLGYLRQVVQSSEGQVIYRCPAEPIEDYVKKGGRIEDTTGRKCLCNALMADIGLGQKQENNYEELPMLTAGDELVHIGQFLCAGKTRYHASDVISELLD